MSKALNIVKALEFRCPFCGNVISGAGYDSVDEFVIACGMHLKIHVHDDEGYGEYVPINVGMSVTDVVKIMKVYSGHFDGDRLVVILDKDKGDE